MTCLLVLVFLKSLKTSLLRVPLSRLTASDITKRHATLVVIVVSISYTGDNCCLFFFLLRSRAAKRDGSVTNNSVLV